MIEKGRKLLLAKLRQKLELKVCKKISLSCRLLLKNLYSILSFVLSVHSSFAVSSSLRFCYHHRRKRGGNLGGESFSRPQKFRFRKCNERKRIDKYVHYLNPVINLGNTFENICSYLKFWLIFKIFNKNLQN